MADLMTHVLVGYTIAVLLSWKYEWITPPYITAAMVGAALPDVVRIRILLDSNTIESSLGVPFSWSPLHTAGGVFISMLILTSFLTGERAKRVFLLLGVGAISHLFLDSLLISASGFSYPLFWPITYQYVPAGGLYLSTDFLPVIISGGLALTVWSLDVDERSGLFGLR